MIDKHLSHYHITAELGRGGMGIVYRAKDTKLHRTVAIKVLPAQALADEDDRTRFYREARAVAQLSQANICHVYQIDEAVPASASEPGDAGTGGGSGEKVPFIVMEFIEGMTLKKHIEQAPLKLKEAVRIALEICLALEAAHEKNIVHRDIKSANVMLTEKGEAKVLDFGLAKTAHSTMLTRMGSTLGTVAYMSPEQARGEEVDNRTDLWSLGVVLYEMIAGRVPAPGDYEQAVVYSILNEAPEPLTALRSGVPMQLEWIVNKCLAKDPDARYQSAKGLLVDLKAVDLTGLTQSMTGAHSRVSSASSQMQGAVAENPRQGATTPSKSLRRKAVMAFSAVAFMALGYFGSKMFESPTPPAMVSRAHLVLNEGSSISNIGVSPDSRYIAYSGWDSTASGLRLFLYDFSTGETQVIQNSVQPWSPRFSDDGERIAFISGGDVKTVSVSGGDAVSVASGAQYLLSWGKDRSIYYSAGRVINRVTEASDLVTEIYSIDSISTASLVFPSAMLPDGEHLLATTDPITPAGKLFVININTGHRTDLLLNEGSAINTYLSSGHLVTNIKNSEIRAYPFDVDELKITGPPVVLAQATTWRSFNVSESGLLVRMTTSGTGAVRQFYKVDFRDKELVPIRSDAMDYEEFRISPSGDFIAVEVNFYQGGDDQIIKFEINTGSIQPMTNGGAHFDPAWNPDGTKIVSGSTGAGEQGAYIQNTDGSGTGGPAWLAPRSGGLTNQWDWSAQDNLLVFRMTGSNESDLFTLSLSDSTVKELINDPGEQRFPRFSRDGRYIAYASQEFGRDQIMAVSTNGGPKWDVTIAGGSEPVWSIDDDLIYFRRATSLLAIPVQTEPIFQVTGVEFEVFRADFSFRFDVHPDGKSVIISDLSDPKGGTLRLVYNLGEYLKVAAPAVD